MITTTTPSHFRHFHAPVDPPKDARPRPHDAPRNAPPPVLPGHSSSRPPPGTFRAVELRGRSEGRPFYRVAYGAPPPPAERALLEYLYGAKVLFIDEARARAGEPVRVPGIVLHEDARADARSFVGDANPALDPLPIETELEDKWIEHELLSSHAPELAPVTLRADLVAAELGLDPSLRTRDPRAYLEALERGLRARLGEYVLKTRLGFGSDGRLPTHEDRLAELWDSHHRELAPYRERLIASGVTDPDELNDRLYEDAPSAESLVIEALLADPSSVLIQKFIPHEGELRVHVVSGRVLDGATVGRWATLGEHTTREQVAAAERAVAALVERVGPISASPDVLITHDGVKVIDLNVGLSSGMYQPENDVFVANLLAQRFRGVETPFLRDLRRFERADLSDKAKLVRALDLKVGRFVRANDASGVADRIVSAYAEHLMRHPGSLLEVWGQVSALESVSGWDLHQLLSDPRAKAAFESVRGEVRQRLVGFVASRRSEEEEEPE